METREPPPPFPPINFIPPERPTDEEKELIANWKRIRARPVSTTNFLWDRMPAAPRKKREEGEEEKNPPEEQIFEESEENTGGSEECENSVEALGETTIHLYNLSSSSSGSS
jgi:hypothetical protein